jgi:hypothetical protein
MAARDKERMVAERDRIVQVLRALNAAENARPRSSAELVSAEIDKLMAPDVEGWTNGRHVPNREAERRAERWLFSQMADYHREVELLIVEPPRATITWTIRGTAGDEQVVVPGSSTFEFDDDGLIRRYWLYCDAAKFAPLSRTTS